MTVGSVEQAVRLEHRLRGDSKEVQRRTERDRLYLSAVADCWPEGESMGAPSTPQETSPAILRGLRAMLKEAGSRARP
eukprot:COSAG01_NODE_52520_length_346_cov_0.631579_1_plen_77_part_10